ncbi:MAG: hypothetical protein IKZ88_00660 [Neisseriaceae bacterium]|nr:hypothetical protein [Neisseriaceae bacterium]
MQFKQPKNNHAMLFKRLRRFVKNLRFFTGLPRLELCSRLAMTLFFCFRLPERLFAIRRFS